ncbi:Gfo/Idh/MocA family oxidoreductase [Paenibacillus oryzisoli]|uniref:Gfo/Idh/MocA family protein n=1 Tax=Paenibacillus oryzisoli TaxID=1850517 RepID=UPI003D2B8E26
MEPVTIVLAGIGGYGVKYVKDLLSGGGDCPFTLVGAVDPYPDQSPFLGELMERGIPIYASLEQFYAASRADLAVICTPIQFHCEHTCLALSHGSHVLCEKPVSVTEDEALRMIAARERAGRFAAVGYQWSYSAGMQALKRDILSGLFGKPKRLRTMVLWPRTDRYYARGWAGRKRDDKGTLILDSVANNATAHYLHNMFYVLGRDIGASAQPAKVTAELYRANPIENYDTAAMRCYTEDGTELLYYGSHAVDRRVGALFHYEFEQAEVTLDDGQPGSPIIARFHSGGTKEYANPNVDSSVKLWAAIAAVRGERDRLVCGIEAALSHTLCINAMQRSVEDIAEFPAELVKRGRPLWNHEDGNYVAGLADQLELAFEQAVLPVEAGFEWARRGREVDV